MDEVDETPSASSLAIARLIIREPVPLRAGGLATDSLAAALSVSPLVLLLPLDGDHVDVGLESPLAAADVLLWMEAQRPPLELTSVQDQASWHRSGEMFEALQNYVAGLVQARSARSSLGAQDLTTSPPEALERFQRSLTSLSETAHRLMLLGAPPPLPEDLKDLEAAGLAWPPSGGR